MGASRLLTRGSNTIRLFEALWLPNVESRQRQGDGPGGIARCFPESEYFDPEHSPCLRQGDSSDSLAFSLRANSGPDTDFSRGGWAILRST